VIYFDSDGCFANFDAHSYSLLGAHPTTVGDQKFWEIANKEPRFWTDMPVMDGAFEFWEKTKHLKPTVLTGGPRANLEFATIAKKEWWKKHFNHEDVIVCLSKDKHTYVSNSEDFLLDDTERHVRKFIKAGGRAIHFQNYEQALTELKEMGIL
jgi:hypothetical protein